MGPMWQKSNPENCKNCSSKCAYDCAQLQYTIQHRTVLTISPLTSRQLTITDISTLQFIHNFMHIISMQSNRATITLSGSSSGRTRWRVSGHILFQMDFKNSNTVHNCKSTFTYKWTFTLHHDGSQGLKAIKSKLEWLYRWNVISELCSETESKYRHSLLHFHLSHMAVHHHHLHHLHDHHLHLLLLVRSFILNLRRGCSAIISSIDLFLSYRTDSADSRTI